MLATITFNLNGEDIVVEDADPLAPLVNTLRERIGLTGTKVACGQGNCGACTVAVKYSQGEGTWRVVNSCLFPTGGLMVAPGGMVFVLTVEGATAKNEGGIPVHPKAEAAGRAIAESNGSQCGFCTPGMVMKAASNCLTSQPKQDIGDIEDLLDGNLCRCTGYRPILYALKKQFSKIGCNNDYEDERMKCELEETPDCVVRGNGASYSSYSKTYSSGDLKNKNVFWPAPPDDGRDGTPSAHGNTDYNANVRVKTKEATTSHAVVAARQAAPSHHKALQASQETYLMPPTTQCSQANLDCPSVNEELRSSRNLRAVSHQAITNESVAEWQMVQVPLAHQGSWYVPTSLKEILDLLAKYPGARIVAGNAASSWVRLFDLPTETKFISIKHVAEFTGEPTFSKEETHRVSFPPCTTLAHFLEFFQSLLTKKQYDVDSIVEHVKAIANIQVRNLGTIAGNVIAAQSRTGILHSDLGLILGAIQSFIWIQVLGEPELCIAIVDFLSDSNGGIPPEYSGKWVCTRISVELPVSGESTVRLARTSCRAYGNFPTLCSTAYSHYDGRTTIHFTGPHGVLHGVIPVEDTSSPGASLKFVRKFLENTTMFLTPAEKRLVIQMSARVLCIDGDDGKMAVSQAKERHLQGQSGEQAFFVDPTQAPVTEPMIKEAAYEHYTGKALYPQDTPPPVGTLNASPVVMPAAIVTFDAWLLKEAAENLLVPIDSKVLILTAADLPVPGENEWVVPNVFRNKDPRCYERMFTRRNVIIDDRVYGTKKGVSDIPAYTLGPGCFGAFVIAPGFTTYAGQTIALILHPDETTSRKLAFKLQHVLEGFFTPGKTWGINALHPNPRLVNLTASHAVRNIAESKASENKLVEPPIHARGPNSKYDLPAVPSGDTHESQPEYDVEAAKQKYDKWWTELRLDPNITYVESKNLTSDSEEHEPVVANRQSHMYMETQTALVRREEDRFYVTSSTQCVSDMSLRLSQMLDVAPRDVVVSNQRIGGGFGGKLFQSINIAALASFSCITTGRPCRVALDRQVDFDVIGKRHEFEGSYRVALNKATRRIVAMELTLDGNGGCCSDMTPAVMTRACITANNAYDIPEFRCTANSWLTHIHTGGAMRSFGAVQTITITEAAMDHAHAQLQSDLNVKLDAAQWRRDHFYSKVDKLPPNAIAEQWTNPKDQHVPPYYPRAAYNLVYDQRKPSRWNYGQEFLETDNMCDPSRGAWAQATVHNTAFQEAKADCTTFNATSTYRKRAVSCTPLLYAAGFPFWRLMQGNASVSIYWGGGSVPPIAPGKDAKGWEDKTPSSGLGYVLVNQGAVEMGNGAQFGIRQAAAAALNVPIGLVRMGRINTDIIPNALSTAASTGSDNNAPAVVSAAHILRERLERMEDGIVYKEAQNRSRGLQTDEIWNAQSKMFHSDKCRPIRPHEQWTKLQESFETTPSERNHVNTYVSAFRSWKHASPDGNPSATFAQIVSEAFIQRVSLLASAGCAPNPDGYPERQDFDRDWFGYYIYACAWTQVEVDGVTGELDVLRSEIFYDAGGSRNPATDIGQVEGAFVQGLGNILTEECQYDFSTGRKVCGLEGRVQKDVKYQTGRLQQRSIMEYAIPSHRSIPRKMGVHLTWLQGSKMVNGKPVSPKDTRSEFEQVQPPPGDLTNRARAKTTGEPSLVLAVSAIGAAREAVRLLKESLLEEKVAFVPLSTPLTPWTLLNAVWGTKSIADMPSLLGGEKGR